MRSNFIYDFNKQKKFKPGYIADNSRLNQEYRKHNKRSMGQKSLLLAKSK